MQETSKKATFVLALALLPIKIIKIIARFLVGATLGLYLLLLLLTSLPVVQRWTAEKLSSVLAEQLQTAVTMSNVRLGLFNRVVVDDLSLLDQDGRHLLNASRLSAKVDILELIKGRVRIASVQLYGYDIRLRRDDPARPYNFQFVIDSFSSDDTTSHTPIDIAIRDIMIRRGSVRHDLTWLPHQEGIDPNHLRVHDLTLHAALRVLTDDSINVEVKRLSLEESSSTLRLRNMQFALEASRSECHVSDMTIDLPGSTLSIPHLEATYSIPDTTQRATQFLAGIVAKADVTGSLLPSDLLPLLPHLPGLSNFSTPFSFSTSVTLADSRLQLGELNVRSQQGLALAAQCRVGLAPPQNAWADIERLSIDAPMLGAVLDFLSSGDNAPVSPTLAQTLRRIGDISLHGRGEYSPTLSQATADISTSIGQASLNATLTDNDHLRLHAETTDIRLAALLDQERSPVDNITISANAEASLKSGTIAGTLTATNLNVNGHTIGDAHLQLRLDRTKANAELRVADDELSFSLIADLADDNGMRFTPDGLTQLQGFVVLDNLRLRTPDHSLHLNDLTLHNFVDADGQHIELSGDFIDAHADGHFVPTTLARAGQQMLHRAMPSVVPTPADTVGFTPSDELAFTIQLWNTDPLLALTDVDLHLPEPGIIRGHFDSSAQEISLRADFAHVIIGSQSLMDVALDFAQADDSLRMDVRLNRQMEDGPVALSLSTDGRRDRLHTLLSWDTHRQPTLYGQMAATSTFLRDERGRIGADISIRPTQVNISDTIWTVSPASISLHDGVVDVNDFEVTQMKRHLRVNGRASSLPSDTLHAHLHDIDLQYVFGLIDFHDVELAGHATGHVAAHNLMASPVVDADLTIPDFHLNYGLLGNLHVLGGWGRKGPHSIDLDGYVTEPDRHLITRVNGIVTPGHDPGSGIDLNIFANYTNIYFINFFTEGILDNVQGRATGYARLFGPFGDLDLEGNINIDTAAVSLGVLGTRYTVVGDSIHLRPGSFFMNKVRVRDPYYGTDSRDHYALLNGRLRHNHFDDISYDFNVEAHDCLGYDFRDFGEQTFYGTVFANGTVHVAGMPGSLTCDIKAHPTAGTTFTYNASSPDAITDNSFITYVTHDRDSTRHGSTTVPHSASPPDGIQESAESDMRINFDLDIGQEATMRLLMDQRSEDNIILHGDGHIRANYHNKGSFQMYGTYRVDRGTYRLSLQDVIRKEFQFEQGSTITFGGQPMKGDLRLRALYTVPSVSLNDLSAGSNFSSSNVRVNCIMNITGQAEHPQISFDFDIPNVNEDEKQMVRSLISTDEERNLQVIYLLGIGRFYTYGTTDQNQTGTAVNSLLSTTLSGQLNNLLANAIGSSASNWNFGTNLSTGNTGWSSVDVEGMLSGRLLNNRLLVNGTFGYRDTPVANTNFIGDFDVQWLLTPSGNVRLKAYSETNDRYFTKSALTTQGLGIQLRKDFNTLRDLFRRR